MPIVYQATNTVNGKFYIGVTRNTIDRRRKEHARDAWVRPFCRKFHAAIRKYGMDAFSWKIVAQFDDYQAAIDDEEKKIAELNPPYNISRSWRGTTGIPRTPEWKAKISAAQKGRKLPPHRAEQTRKMCLEFLKLRQRGVVCLDENKWFASVKDASEHYGVGYRTIHEVIAGRQNTTGGKCFFASKAPLKDEQCEAALRDVRNRQICGQEKIKRGVRVRSVICDSTSEVFRSGADAARAVGMKPSTLLALCRSGGTSLNGMKFSYLETK